jgi:hypothetical protein
MLFALLLAAAAPQAPQDRPLEIVFPLTAACFGEWTDVLSTHYSETIGGVEGNVVVRFASQFRFGELALKFSAAVGITAGDVWLQIGSRKLWWPHWVVWAYRGAEAAGFAAVDFINSRGGLRIPLPRFHFSF